MAQGTALAPGQLESVWLHFYLSLLIFTVICPTDNERHMERLGLEVQLCQLAVEVGLSLTVCI